MPRISKFIPILMAAALVACGQPKPPQMPPPSVEVITVKAHPVPTIIALPGRLQAVRTAEVRARVDGIVQRRLYGEGTDVRAGAPLFSIDPRQMRASYSSALAALRRAEAAAKNALQIVNRYRPLVADQAISDQEYDAAVANTSQAQADVASARAAVDRARLDLDYTTVTAPISGRAGRAQVTEGALVSAGSATLLTTIEQLDPLFVNFSQSSSELLRIRREMAASHIRNPDLSRVRVQLELEDGTPYSHEGHLDFLDLSVDESTGTVSLRAEVPNPGRILLPGQFVRAKLIGGVTASGISLPQRAVLVSGQGASVFVVGKDNLATVRPVRLGQMQGNEWIILDGVKAGDRVIVNGQQKVRPGAPVAILPVKPKASGAK